MTKRHDESENLMMSNEFDEFNQTTDHYRMKRKAHYILPILSSDLFPKWLLESVVFLYCLCAPCSLLYGIKICYVIKFCIYINKCIDYYFK